LQPYPSTAWERLGTEAFSQGVIEPAASLPSQLNVLVHCDAGVRMSHQRLRRRNVRPIRVNQRSKRMPERVPSHSLGDTCPKCRWPDVVFHCRLRPVRLGCTRDARQKLVTNSSPKMGYFRADLWMQKTEKQGS